MPIVSIRSFVITLILTGVFFLLISGRETASSQRLESPIYSNVSLPTQFTPSLQAIATMPRNASTNVGLSFPQDRAAYTYSNVLPQSELVSGWERQSLPDGIQQFSGVSFVGTQQGWAIGAYSTGGSFIVKTTDGGQTWSINEMFPDFILTDITFADSSTGWAVGGEKNDWHYLVILCTNDGGSHWTRKLIPSDVRALTDFNSTRVRFVDGTNGWVSGILPGWPWTSVVLRTTDGGQTWNTYSIASFDEFQITGMAFTDQLHGWVAGWVYGGGPCIYTTADGGQTWLAQTVPSGMAGVIMLQDITFADSNVGWAVGFNRDNEDGIILSTVNGGQTWVTQTLPPWNQSWNVERIYGVAFADSNRGVAVGWSGIMTTQNGGNSWTLLETNTNGIPGGFRSLTKAIFVNATTVWAVARIVYGGGYLWRSTDSGQTWNPEDVGTRAPSAQGVAFLDPNNGWIAGNDYGGYGLILKTNNGGQSWIEKKAQPAKGGLRSVNFVSPTAGWFIGGSDVFHTTDGGDSLLKQSIPVVYSDTIQIHNGTIYLRQGDVVALLDASFVSSTQGFIVGTIFTFPVGNSAGGFILSTVDSGQTWTAQALPAITGWAVEFVDANMGWVAGTDYSSPAGYILKTSNAGQTWTTQTVPTTTQYIDDVFFLDSLRGWAVGCDPNESSLILTTTDGGTTWRIQSTPQQGILKGITFSDSTHGWAIGGGIIATADAGETWFQRPEDIFIDLNGSEMTFVSPSTGWAVGGIVLNTLDGGIPVTPSPTSTSTPAPTSTFTPTASATSPSYRVNLPLVLRSCGGW